MAKKIVVGISARHLHVSQEDLEILFGEGAELTMMKELGQPGQYASNERVDVVTEKGSFPGVRILGPVRKQTQVEISMSDALKLKIKPPVRDSGDIEGTPGVKLVGPKGEVVLDKGVIVAKRHIHMTPADAEEFGVKDKELVKVAIGGERGLIFDNVLIRVHDSFALEMHLDTDEGNASLCSTGDLVEIVK
jgi:putative phosphotransacetylase